MIVSIGNAANYNCKTVADQIREDVAQTMPFCRTYQVFAVRSAGQKTDARLTDSVCTSLKQALERIRSDRVRSFIVQPTYLVYGREYRNLADELRQYEKAFEQVVLAEPLLAKDADFEAVGKILLKQTADYNTPDTAVCFIGHGKEAGGPNSYIKMRKTFTQAGCRNYYVGTIKGEPSFHTVTNAFKEAGGYKRVVLYPFMVAAGRHVYRDIAGGQGASWKQLMEQEGYEVVCIPKGLGQISDIRHMFAEHAKAAFCKHLISRC